MKKFKRAQSPYYDLIATARVSALSPIIIGKFAWAFFNDEVTLTQGECFYFVLSTQLTNPKTSCLLVLEVRRPEQ
jgi:hypothetical protein